MNIYISSSPTLGLSTRVGNGVNGKLFPWTVTDKHIYIDKCIHKISFAFAERDDSFAVRYPTDVKSARFQSQLEDSRVSCHTEALRYNERVCLGMTIYIYFFHYTTCEITCDTLSSLAANQGDNTVSVAQGGTATTGATKQLLPPDRVFKRNIYIYIYIYARSTKIRHYIGRSFIFILVQFVI